ncbi:endolytic transglycosylase MltG [Sporolactobacillus sp. THM7-7]|nr:endolytic transglycosylase MltG [Sporolactobacillus sp. THM7-7]
MKVHQSRWRLAILLAVSLAVILAFAAWGLSAYYNRLLEPVDPYDKKAITVTVKHGSSIKDIGREMERKGLIRKAWAFELYARWHHLDQYQAGMYTFNRSMSVGGLMNNLKNGRYRKVVQVVDVRQGMWIKEIAGQMADVSGLNVQDILDKLNDPSYVKNHYMKNHKFLTGDIFAKGVKYPLEGYLAPGIYKYDKNNATLDQMVNEMLDRTGKTISRYHDDMASNKLGSVHRILTMASLVEQEAPGTKDRRRIAGVFYNRLDRHMKLQTDPSIDYGQQRRIQEYTAQDLKRDTPYNTYTRKGLTAGPIGSPAADAIEAVLKPIRSKDLYFYARPNGRIYYSETYSEHREIVAKYRHEWASQS